MSDRHEHLDEGTIHAWLDGALPPDESARVESAAASCAECASLVAEARGLIAASSRILSSLDTVPAGVIPGTHAEVDQLARLRARRQATTRHWWQDRRYVAAASLILIAGVSSLVLRSSPDEATLMHTEPVAESSATVLKQPQSVDAAPPASAPASAGTREASARRDAKADAAPLTRDVARARAAATAPVDSAAMQKVAAATAAPPTPAPVAGVVANEARRDSIPLRERLADSLVGQRLARQDVAAESQLRLQGQSRQALQQQQPRADSIARARLGSASLRLSEVVVTGVGAEKAERAELAGACFRLRVTPVQLPGRATSVVVDSLKLLQEQVPVLSDPAWFRTQIFAAVRDTTLAWRSIDSVTVELRAGFGSDTSAVRFRTDGALEGLTPPRVRLSFAERIPCPR